MQVQSGVIIANAAGGPVSYGYTATAKTGTLDNAFMSEKRVGNGSISSRHRTS